MITCPKKRNNTTQNKTSRNIIYENPVPGEDPGEEVCRAFRAGDTVVTHLLCSLEMDGKLTEGADQVTQTNGTVVEVTS